MDCTGVVSIFFRKCSSNLRSVNTSCRCFPVFSSYLSLRLLGSALPHLSLPQLKEVLSGEVMMQYGMHVVSAQVRALN